MASAFLPDTYDCLHCGKVFSAQHRLSAHQGKCKFTKRRLSMLLEETRSHWEARKRAKRDAVNNPENHSTQPTHEPLTHAQPLVEHSGATTSTSHVHPMNDLDVPVAQRKAHRPRRLPKRYRSDSPKPEAQTRRNGAPPGPNHANDVETPASENAFEFLVVHPTERDAFGISKSYTFPPEVKFPEVINHTLPPELRHAPSGTENVPRATSSQPPLETPSTAPSAAPSAGPRSTDPSTSPSPGSSSGPSKVPSRIPSEPSRYGPFESEAAFALAEWYWNSTRKSFQDFQALIAVLKTPNFSLRNVIGVNWKTAFKALGSSPEDLSNYPSENSSWVGDDGWRSQTVSIEVTLHSRTRNPGTQAHTVGDFRYRPLLSIIKERLTRQTQPSVFHYYPYEASWKPTKDSPAVETYGELYASRSFRQVHEELQRQPATARNKGLERVVVALMFWSDGTHLTSFGSAAVWPCYFFFGNESKYERRKSSEAHGEQVAYFIKLPDNFKDTLTDRNQGKLPSAELLKYCAKVLFHKQWSILLGAELVDAMENGLILDCPDKQRRCFYPRFFTYCADYPERILIAGIRNNGGRPCHRCLVPESELGMLGTPSDDVRRNGTRCEATQAKLVWKADKIIKGGRAVKGKAVEAMLKDLSLVPVPNAISTALSPLKFELIPSLIADILHEFEIGVWKNLFIHLIRILSTRNPSVRAALDYRYRATPTFGRDTIRKFNTNASEMKRKAARDYEDLLQCAIAAFESLLPEPHNTALMALLYICAQWYSLAKLRFHNDFTVNLLEHTTILLGAQMRKFDRDVCTKYHTKELQKEADARVRRASKGGKPASSACKPVSLGVFTIKFHLLGDYGRVIRTYGTTDSFSSEIGESFHRQPKSWYPRTDKKDYQGQFVQIERRLTHLARIREGLDVPTAQEPSWDTSNAQPAVDRPTAQESSRGTSDAQPAVDGPVVDTTSSQDASTAQPAAEVPAKEPEGPDDSLDSSYSIGSNQHLPIHITAFREPEDAGYSEGYFSDFVPKLKQHLLSRLLEGLGFEGDAMHSLDWTKVVFQNDYIYRHKTMRLLYTTYDARRGEDIVHTSTSQSSVMFLNGAWVNGSKQPPYLYAKVLGVFHMNVSYTGALPDGKLNHAYHRIDVVWVRWYDSLSHGEELQLDRVSPHPLRSEKSLDFVDPGYIVRALHVTPRFAKGKANNLTPPSMLVNEGQLWKEYYINRFADRDIFMRYQYGMSVGHRYMYAPDFPSRTDIPPIPPDFDHGLRPLSPQGSGTLPGDPVSETEGVEGDANESSRGGTSGSPPEASGSGMGGTRNGGRPTREANVLCGSEGVDCASARGNQKGKGRAYEEAGETERDQETVNPEDEKGGGGEEQWGEMEVEDEYNDDDDDDDDEEGNEEEYGDDEEDEEGEDEDSEDEDWVDDD